MIDGAVSISTNQKMKVQTFIKMRTDDWKEKQHVIFLERYLTSHT